LAGVYAILFVGIPHPVGETAETNVEMMQKPSTLVRAQLRDSNKIIKSGRPKRLQSAYIPAQGLKPEG